MCIAAAAPVHVCVSLSILYLKYTLLSSLHVGFDLKIVCTVMKQILPNYHNANLNCVGGLHNSYNTSQRKQIDLSLIWIGRAVDQSN